MENYNIYDEIGRGTHSFVYKARRKRSIEYVAVKSTAKSRMDKILNEVPFLHKLDSPYVVKFFDWYESSNHIWLILEYCMGGDLLNLITQDKQLPEFTVKTFGVELVAGLQYLHSNSILYCDLKPANIMIDEFGSLKLADFGLARRIPGSDAAPERPLAPGSPHYMAPELFQQPAIHSFASDFWALGCVLYEMKTGRQPFTHTNFSELARKIQTDPVELPVPGFEMSPKLCNLLGRLLVKNPYQRITWDELVDHPFWDDLPRLEKLKMPAQETFDSDSPALVHSSSALADEDAVNNSEDNSHQTDPGENGYVGHNGVANTTNGVQQPLLNSIEKATTEDRADGELNSGDPDLEEISSTLPAQANGTNHVRQGESRPVSAPNRRARASSNNNAESDDDTEGELLVEPPDMRRRWRSAKAPHSAPPALRHATKQYIQLSSLFDRNSVSRSLRKVSKLVFTAADCRVKSIIGNKDIKIEDLPRVQANLLRFTLITPEGLLSCSTEALENQLKEIYISLKSSHADVQEKLSVMAYLFSLSCHARLAHVIVNSSILKLLIRMLAHESDSAASNKTMLSMVCLVLGVLFRFATFIAPSSPDQLQLFVQTLLEVVGGSETELPHGDTTDMTALQPRPLALACLGELLFYISTQQEWELPMDGVEIVLACIDDPNTFIRYYAVRTLGNMLIHSGDALLPQFISEKIVSTLIRGVLQYATPLDGQIDENMVVALRTAATEALAQSFRHLRSPSAAAKLPSRLKRSVMLLIAKPEVLNAVWRGVEDSRGSADLAIASFNIVNSFLDMKLDTFRDAESAAIKSSRTLLLERTETLETVQKVLEIDNASASGIDDESLTILRGKSLIMLHLGIQLNRSFLLQFVEKDALALVEKMLDSIAVKMSDTSVSETKLSAFEMYVVQCALNVCKLSIRMALKLGADCFSSHENGDDESNNAERRPPRISSIPFQLFNGLIRNPNCRQQLFNYFIANDSKQFTFFLRLMSKLLTSFADGVLRISRVAEEVPTVGQYVTQILRNLFDFAASEATGIVLVEKQLLFSYLLPAIVKNIEPRGSCTVLAVTCLHILHTVLLDFDFEDDTGGYELYDPFIRSVLLPKFNQLVDRREATFEIIWSLTSELLFGLLSSDSTLLNEAKDLTVVSTVLGLLNTPSEFHALPSHAIQLVQMVIDSAVVHEDALYEAGIIRSIIAGITFTSKRKELDGSLVDVTEILLSMLHQQFERKRQSGTMSAPPGFDEVVNCGPLMLQLCSRGNVVQEPQDENEADSSLGQGGLADLASRCLVLLSQIFGEQLTEVMFTQSKPAQREANLSVTSSLLSCLQSTGLNEGGVMVLRVLLTLKHGLRCQDNNAHISHWMAENPRVLDAIEGFVSPRRSSAEESGSNRPSVGGQISKAAAAIVRQCRSSAPQLIVQ
ncbi:hypothetical protein V7S43_002827 [Phytophthora oleae]|uniref:Protein kinase domain-containing protein n=1 Tax=Phytophthora oleae TaxID=2107226 RepID=A0ABD3FZE9_9STRA